MRRLKGIYPEFRDQVEFYAVAQDPTETLGEIEELRRDEDYPWPAALPIDRMLVDFRVLQQSTKVAIDGMGVIVYRDGYGDGGDEEWRQVFRDLAAGRGP